VGADGVLMEVSRRGWTGDCRQDAGSMFAGEDACATKDLLVP